MTVRDFLKTALLPCGKALYVWAGGWNEADTGAGSEALSFGVSPEWEAFFKRNRFCYDAAAHRGEIHRGLDCSGFAGWALYQAFGGAAGGYVTKAERMADWLAKRGLGRAENVEKETLFPGDLVSIEGHVWISLGKCRDDSFLILHSSAPGGVQLCGTVRDGEGESTASFLASSYMKSRCPLWEEAFSAALTRAEKRYLSGRKVTLDTLPDPDCLRRMNAEEVLQRISE